MSREASLWRWLRGAEPEFKHTLHMDRVENALMKGPSDVEGQLRGAGQFWLELKTADRPARNTTPVRFKVRDREEQVRWMRRRRDAGGHSYMLLQVDSGRAAERYLVPGEFAEEVYEGVTEGVLGTLCVLGMYRKSASAAYVVRAAAEGRGLRLLR